MRSKIGSIFRYLFRRQKEEQALDAELGYHLDRLTEQNIARGLRPTEARRQAMIAIGGIEPTKEQCRDSRRGRIIESFIQDVRHGLRMLRKNPGFASAAILTLALGIGANTAIFSVVYGVLLRPLPYAQGGQLVVLHQSEPKAHLNDMGFSVKEIVDYRTESHTLQSVVEHHSMNFMLIDKDSASRVETGVVSANFFDVLGVQPILGRTFVASDEAQGGPAVMVLSYKFWRSLGGDPHIVGKTFRMNRRTFTAIGVLPPIPQYPAESDVYMTTTQCPARSSAEFIADRQSRMMIAFARLKPGVTVEQAQADLSVVARAMEQAHADAYPPDAGYSIKIAPLRDDLTRRARAMFLVLLGATGFVLLIACANVANLLLARLLKLERELAVRAALGATKMRLVRQVLTESVVLAVFGGIAGVALAPPALVLLVKFAARFTDRAAEVHMDAPVLLFALALSVLTGVVFGLAPALFPGSWIGGAFSQAANWSTASRGRQRLRGALVIAQVGVSVILLVGAGLMIRSFARLQRVNPGFVPDRLLTLRVTPSAGLNDLQRVRMFEGRLVTKVRALPGVESVALASSFPFNPSGVIYGPAAHNYEIEGRQAVDQSTKPRVDLRAVSVDYFETLRQAIVRGRSFTERDESSGGGIIINETMARHFFQGENPIGKRMRVFEEMMGWTPWQEIVGVAADVREYGLARLPSDEAYTVTRAYFINRMIVRTALDAGAAGESVRTAIHEVAPLTAIDQMQTIERAEYESMASPRVMTMLLAIFAGLAVLISAGGIAAVMALAVRQRTREIGVRMALGAHAGNVVSMVLRQGLGLALCGTLLGMAGAALLTRLLATFLYDTSSRDVVTFIAAPLLFLVVSAVACFVPARQVTSIDPLAALRQD